MNNKFPHISFPSVANDVSQSSVGVYDDDKYRRVNNGGYRVKYPEKEEFNAKMKQVVDAARERSGK